VTDWRSGPYVRDLVAASHSATYSVHPGPQWTVVRRTDVQLPEHGWKLHVSSRPETFAELTERLVPVLLAEGCGFKLAAGSAVLAGLNQGREAPGTVGKAVTIYPDQSRVRELGLALADLLRGHTGPRILSDRRVDEDAPVYYRYGPFVHRWYRGKRGVMAVGILGPDGEIFDALAGLEYRQPSWVTDPFRPAGEPEAPELLGEAVYGMPELHRDAIREASLVAGPGCYPTAALLGLWPLRDLMRDAIVDAKSGVSGAGREATGTTHFVTVDENVSAYKVEGHRHRAELEQELGSETPITFTPHLVPLDQGLLASCYVTAERELSADELRGFALDGLNRRLNIIGVPLGAPAR